MLNFCLEEVKAGRLDCEDADYPVQEIHKFTRPGDSTLTGVDKNKPMVTEYAVVLRATFAEAGAADGPKKNIYFRVLPAGTCGVTGGLIGFPVLDRPPLWPWTSSGAHSPCLRLSQRGSGPL